MKEADRPVLNPEGGEHRWFVLRCHGMSGPKVRASLDAEGVEWFQPSCEDVVMEKGRKVKRKVYLMRDFVFVHSTKGRIEELIDGGRLVAWLYYDLCHRVHHEPVVVPDKAMEDFMRVSGALDRRPEIRCFDESDVVDGTRIKLMNGPFQGVEGIYRQRKHGRNSELLVTLSNFMTVSVALEKDELIEILS